METSNARDENAAEAVAALCRQADALRARGSLSEAARTLEEALRVEPRSSEARLSLAQIRSAEGRHDEAAAHFMRLTQDHPDQALLWWKSAVALRELGKFAEALASIERYAALCPNDAGVQVRCAETALDLADPGKGLALIARARVIDPTNAAARFLEGRMLFEEGDTDKAIEAYRDAARDAPHLGVVPGGRVTEVWTMNFPAWAATGAGECRVLAPSCVINLPEPSVIPREEARFWPAGPQRVPEIFIGTIEHAEVLPPESTVLASDGCLFVKGFVTSPAIYAGKVSHVRYAASDGRLLVDLPHPVKEVDGACVLLSRSNNYFHFMFESLPRIWSVEQLGVDRSVPALVPDNLYQTELELLELLGFPAQRLIAVPDGAAVRCRKLFAPSLFGEGYVVSERAVHFLRERVLSRVSRVPDLPKRVYLSRNRMARRHVSNESELLPLLERYGFKTVYPEDLGVAEQVRMFAEADAILSPDSSALANVAFASPHTRVGVLSWRGLYKPLWHCIALHAGVPLTYIHADPVVESDPMLAHRDLRVDPALLERWMKTL